MTSPPNSASSRRRRALTVDNISPFVRAMHYPVRGPIFVRSIQIEKELLQGEPKPFENVIRATFGDGHALGQQPITFLRQVLALTAYPSLMSDPSIPPDAKQRASMLLAACRGRSIGSYTESIGLEIVREHVAAFIQQRDGCPSSADDIVLCNGAADGIRSVLKLFVTADSERKSGILAPVPQYPLYSAKMKEMNLEQIDYYLDESKGWGITVEELKRAINEAKRYCTPRALVVINPGNPTGNVLTKKNIREIIEFAYEENLLILADEVYQENIYDENSEFHSFKKVMYEMGSPFSDMELASFMTCSKGFYGECGLRGGYVELHNFDRDVQSMFTKAVCALLCPNILGSIALDCVIKPPTPGDPSYPLFRKEMKMISDSLIHCARFVTDTFNSVEGMSCTAIQGSLYAFPKIYLPPNAIKAAKDLGLHPDAYYCFELLEQTGVCIVPGSGFGQEDGTYHFRTTIFPNTDILQELLKRIIKFHHEFLRRHQ